MAAVIVRLPVRQRLMVPSCNDSLAEEQNQLRAELALLRFIRALHADSFILVNIPGATLTYIVRDSVSLRMRVVVGAPEHRTPRFAAGIRQVTLYPYWNMPRSILLQEWLPAFRNNPAAVQDLNMEVVDGKGRIIDPGTIRWSMMTETNFPYRIRQRTGCENPLGVVKFSTDAPFDVYLHDTNFKGVFLSAFRYKSHGCIRVEDPVRLANALLPVPVDTAYLRACFRNEQPKILDLASPVPVFVMYNLYDEAVGGGLQRYRDVYGLSRRSRQ